MKTQRPLLHGTPLQQSLLLVQTWPYPAQVGGGPSVGTSAMSTSAGGLASPVPPPSPGGGRPHMPRVEPGGSVQGKPGQQSAAVVQVPPLATHSPPHTNGGKPPSAVKPGFGTQVRPQQSALVAHG